MALDPSKGKDARRGDYQAIIFLVVTHAGELFVDCDMRRRPVRQLVEDMVAYTMIEKPDVAVVESNQFQECIVNECHDEAIRRKLLTPVVPMNNGSTNKNVRIRRLDPYVSRHRIKFKKRSRGARMLVEQMCVWPTGDHDDGPDALEMAVRKAGQLMAGDSSGVVEDPT
jgi:predicted phage terminase large subunit-like protein